MYNATSAPVCSAPFDGAFERDYEGTVEMPVPVLQAHMREEMLALRRANVAAAGAAAYGAPAYGNGAGAM